MKLHELEHFEFALELEEPLWLELEQDFNSIACLPAKPSFIDSSVDNLKTPLRVLYADLRYKSLIVLRYIDNELLRFSRSIGLQLTDSELQAGKTFWCHRMLNLRSFAQVRSHWLILKRIGCLRLLFGRLRACLFIRPSEARLLTNSRESLLDYKKL